MTVLRFVLLLMAALPIAFGAVLFQDDFSRLPAGRLSAPVGTLNGAIQEYHCLPHRGVPLWPWENAICHVDSWVAGDEDGATYLEQHEVNGRARLMNPIFITGDPIGAESPARPEGRPTKAG